jgi:uracil phosphoribosyltransferase
MKQIVLQASDLDGYLTEQDKKTISMMDGKFAEAMELFPKLGAAADPKEKVEARTKLIALYNEMGEKMQDIARKEPNIHVYSFETPRSSHGEASRLIAKLRDIHTETPEFVYYIQRAYELLFNFTFSSFIP